jgi:hypothetical protein
MGAEGTVEVGAQVSSHDKDAASTPPTLEADAQMSNLRLIILGAAFFALWAGNVGFSLPLAVLKCRLILSRLHLFCRLRRSYLLSRRSSESQKVRYNG